MARTSCGTRKRSDRRLVNRYLVTDGSSFRLKDVKPGDDGPRGLKRHAEALLKGGVERLSKLQELLYAQDRWSLLLIFQAMDAAGKDGTIKHVMSGVNPQGTEVYSFKAPTHEELDHDFLWRTTKRMPERGRIGVFNRSYYEEVLVVRVHPEILAAQRLPPSLVTKQIWKDRFEDINNFERYASRNGTIIRKFFLHVSKGEQKRRFLKRVRGSDQALEVLEDRFERTRTLGRVHGRLRVRDSPHLVVVGAVGRGAGRSQVVCQAGRRSNRH